MERLSIKAEVLSNGGQYKVDLYYSLENRGWFKGTNLEFQLSERAAEIKFDNKNGAEYLPQLLLYDYGKGVPIKTPQEDQKVIILGLGYSGKAQAEYFVRQLFVTAMNLELCSKFIIVINGKEYNYEDYGVLKYDGVWRRIFN